MKFRAAGIFSLCLLTPLISMTLFNTACGPSNPTSPKPTVTPTTAPQVLWKNGTVGTWLGSSLTFVTAPSSSTSTVAVTDNVTGDTSTLRFSLVTASSYAGGLYFELTSSPEDPTVYYPTGLLQFDMRLEQTPSFFQQLALGYGNSSPVTYSLTPSNYSTSTFTHISVPFGLFSGNGGNGVTVPFYFYASLYSSPTGTVPLATFDNIQWTVR